MSYLRCVWIWRIRDASSVGASPFGTDRTQAVALAEEALKIFREGKLFEKRVRQVERWLDEHRG